MPSVALTRAGVVSPIAGFLSRVGAPVETLLARAGLPPWVLTDPERLIPTSSTARFMTEAARIEGIENLGLLAGQETRVETLGVFGRLIRRGSTVGEALEATVQNHPLFSSNGRMWLASRGKDVEFCQAFTSRFDEGWRHANHYILMMMLGIIRLGAGANWRPPEVRFQTGESAPVRDVEALSAARISFAQPATAIVLPRSLLDSPIRPPRLDLKVPEDGPDAWNASAPAEDFVGSIAQVVETLSWESYPDIHLTADILGMSVRTLQRHLAAAGFTHEALVGRARFATAAGLLEETDTKILDIALDLGYSDHAHFTRAFLRWAGCSPQEFRRKCRGRVGGSNPAAF
jgi:AraC-like DNA-binding protein